MVRLCLSWLLLLSSLAASWAQTPPPAEADSVGRVGSEIETIAPYSGWRTHTGKVEDAIALFEVTPKDELDSRYSTGLVIRCDGFLLAPAAVTDAMDNRATVRVRLSGAENEKLPNELKVDGRPASHSRRGPVSPLKVNGHHVKCVRLLDASNVAVGEKVQLFWAVPVGGGFQTQTKSAVVGRQGEKDRWFLESITEKLMPGTVVVDEASGAPIGMVPTVAEPGEFASFLYFADNCGEVALAPTPDAAKGIAKDVDGMKHVRGGPAQLSGPSAKDALRLYGTDIVCTPDFYCDRVPVTIGQYESWRNSQRLLPVPASWRDAPKAFPPTRLPGWPVSGVRPEEVRRYAADYGKRLLTEAEWIRASYQPDGGGVNELANAVDRAVDRLATADQTLATGIRIRRSQQRFVGVRSSRTGARNVPVSPVIDDLIEAWIQEISRTVLELTETLPKGEVRGAGFPYEVNGFPKDSSVWGILGTATNLPEMLLDRGTGVKITWKPFASRLDPFVTQVQWNVSGLAGGVGIELGAAEGRQGASAAILVETADPLYYKALFGARNGQQSVEVSMPMQSADDGPKAVAMQAILRSYVVRPVAYPAFRLAR